MVSPEISIELRQIVERRRTPTIFSACSRVFSVHWEQSCAGKLGEPVASAQILVFEKLALECLCFAFWWLCLPWNRFFLGCRGRRIFFFQIETVKKPMQVVPEPILNGIKFRWCTAELQIFRPAHSRMFVLLLLHSLLYISCQKCRQIQSNPPSECSATFGGSELERSRYTLSLLVQYSNVVIPSCQMFPFALVSSTATAPKLQPRYKRAESLDSL